MALVPCVECGQSISDRAPSCPHCGRPQAKPTAEPVANPRNVGGRGAFFLVVALAAGALIFLSPKSPSSTASTQKGDSPEACGDDLACLAKAARFKAGELCRDDIQRRAKYSFEWTNWAVDGIFTQYNWRDRQAKTIVLSGDKVKFQNGFGAWSIMNYQCDYDPIRNSLLGVRLGEGQLPKIESQ